MLTNLAAHLDRAIKAAGVPIVGVSIGNAADKTTWEASPLSLQSAAQPTIDAFDPADPAHAAAEAADAARVFADDVTAKAFLLFYLRHQFGGVEPTNADWDQATAELKRAYADGLKQ